MSDEEYDAEGWGSDEQNSNGGVSDSAVEIENNFFEAEGNLKDNPQDALDRFETVVLLEE